MSATRVIFMANTKLRKKNCIETNVVLKLKIPLAYSISNVII